jgi:hypothetical protein
MDMTMKHMIKSAALLTVLLAMTPVMNSEPIHYHYIGSQTQFLPRPQGLNSAALFDPYYYDCCDKHDTCAYSYIGYRFNQTFDGEKIAECLFGLPSLNFIGSKASTEETTQLIGDFVGLAPNIESNVIFCPRITNNMVDFAGRWDFACCSPCLANAYLGLYATLARSSWKLGMVEETGTVMPEFSNFPECYMSGSAAAAAPDAQTALGGQFTFGDMKTPWSAGKIRCESHSKTLLANIDLLLGYDFLRCPDYHVGLFARVGAPTGNRPDPEFVFAPVVGNGHHWEFGGGLDAHWTVWNCDSDCVQLYLTGSVSHLFKDKQYRTFDFKDTEEPCLSGSLSRYTLLKEFDAAGVYTGNLINAVNFTTRSIESSFGVQGDASLRLLYKHCGWAFGLGYNVYGRSEEKLQHVGVGSDAIQGKHYGIKGTTGTCARSLTEATVGLNATESRTRMFNLGPNEEQDYVDNAVSLPNNITWDSTTDPATITIAQDSQLNGNPAPVYVTTDDLDVKGIPRQVSHKIFAHIDYQCENSDCCCWQPFIGIGGEVEFPQGPCEVCTPHMWGVWAHIGSNF